GCVACHSGGDEDKILLCDGCDKEFHTYCLDPPLKEVPEGQWYCVEC
ncbi:unnamed protein product, partial [Discosporangium mesarthrocarpum]